MVTKHLFLSMLIAVTCAATGCTHSGASAPVADEPVAVKLAPVSIESLALPVIATGTLEPKESATLGFKIGGVVARVLVHEGDRVRKGQLLAALDLGEIEPAVTRARTAAEKADRDCQRAERLYADSVATLEQLQDARSGRDAAKAEYEGTLFNRGYAVITAPSAGVVLHRLVEPGEVLTAGTPVISLGIQSRGQVLRAGLSDRDLVRVRLGDRAAVRFDAMPGRVFEGRVSEIAAAADPTTGTYGIEVSLPGASGLPSGFVGTVEVRPRGATPLAMVPVESVLEANGDAGVVYTVGADGKRAERRAVQLAFLAGERVAIRSGLEGVRMVVTEGADRLDAGDRVEVAR